MTSEPSILSVLQPFIGQTEQYTEPFPIDAGMIRRFAEVIGDENPLYFDEAHARTTAFGGIVAPPTLLFEWNHHEHGGIPAAASEEMRGRLSYRPATVRGVNEYTITQPLRPGDVITSKSVLSDLYVKEGRTGTLTFIVFEIAYTNQQGQSLGETRDTFIALPRPQEAAARGGTADPAPPSELTELVTELSVEQFARYAAVCWDFAAIHYDSVAAQAQGYYAAYADGPMVTAMLARQASEWTGRRGLVKRLEASYRGMMFPGDTLTCSGRLLSEREDEDGSRLSEYEVWAANQDGRSVVRGTASVSVPSAGADAIRG